MLSSYATLVKEYWSFYFLRTKLIKPHESQGYLTKNIIKIIYFWSIYNKLHLRAMSTVSMIR